MSFRLLLSLLLIWLNLPMFSAFIEPLMNKLISSVTDEKAKRTLELFEKEISKNSRSLAPLITSTELNAEESLATFAVGNNYDPSYRSFAYGAKRNNKITKLLITGAKGSYKSKGDYLSAVGVSEVFDRNQIGLAAVDAYLFKSGFFYTEAKVTNFDLKISVTPLGQLEVVLVKGQRFSFQKGTKIVASSTLYRLLVGKAYAKYFVYEMNTGVGVYSSNRVIKSFGHTTVKTFELTKGKLTKGEGVFYSQSNVNRSNCISSHTGQLVATGEEEAEILKAGSFSKTSKGTLEATTFAEQDLYS